MNIKIFKYHADAKLPFRANEYDAGADLYAVENGTIHSQSGYDTISYKTGIGIEIPPHYTGLIFPRSSIKNMCLQMVNSVAVIDHGYIDEILLNFRIFEKDDFGNKWSKIYQKGDRIAQLIILPLPQINFIEGLREEFVESRGGFGSTGTS
jgi:dUTP pyrophosphatase